MEGRLLLDVVVRKSAAVLELLTSEDEALLIRGDTLLVLNLGLHVVDGVRGLDLKGNGLTSEGLDEDLHTTAETKDEMESGLLLDVVIGKGAAILELLAGEDEALLVGRNALLVLDLSLDVVDGVRRLDLESDRLAGEGLDENLHTTTEAEHQVEGALLLNVIVRESAAVLELLAGEDEALLVGRNTLLILDLSLHVVNGVGRLDLESDSLTREGLDEDLHVVFGCEVVCFYSNYFSRSSLYIGLRNNQKRAIG